MRRVLHPREQMPEPRALNQGPAKLLQFCFQLIPIPQVSLDRRALQQHLRGWQPLRHHPCSLPAAIAATAITTTTTSTALAAILFNDVPVFGCSQCFLLLQRLVLRFGCSLVLRGRGAVLPLRDSPQRPRRSTRRMCSGRPAAGARLHRGTAHGNAAAVVTQLGSRPVRPRGCSQSGR